LLLQGTLYPDVIESTSYKGDGHQGRPGQGKTMGTMGKKTWKNTMFNGKTMDRSTIFNGKHRKKQWKITTDPPFLVEKSTISTISKGHFQVRKVLVIAPQDHPASSRLTTTPLGGGFCGDGSTAFQRL